MVGQGIADYHRFLPLRAKEYLARVIAEPFVLTCSTGWSRITAGGQAVVAGMPGDPPIRVRREAKLGDNVFAQIFPGTAVKVLEGPVCADGLVF